MSVGNCRQRQQGDAATHLLRWVMPVELTTNKVGREAQ